MAPTELATENIGGKTIHLALRIKDTLKIISNHHLCIYAKVNKVIIINEISIISSSIDLFAKLHNKPIEFGDVSVLLIIFLHC
jgi:hypothetical protein